MVKLNCLDLFCGVGGMAKGLTDAGINIVAGVDIWSKAIDNYKKNFNHLGICADLTTYTPENLIAAYKENEKLKKKKKIVFPQIDIITGGVPCQGFSNAGKREINDPRNTLFMNFKSYVDYFNPKVFVIENVMGILSMKMIDGVLVIDKIKELFDVNYNVVIHKLYASDYGVPQNRRRVIIMGIRKDLNIIPVEPPKIINTIEERPAVSTVLLPREEIEQSYFLTKRAIDGISVKKEKMKEKGNGFGAQILNLDKPSFTIPARYWKDGRDALVKYDNENIRKLTELELKRIQSFPDDYIIEGSKKDICMMIGNAVACQFAYHIGKYIVDIIH